MPAPIGDEHGFGSQHGCFAAMEERRRWNCGIGHGLGADGLEWKKAGSHGFGPWRFVVVIRPWARLQARVECDGGWAEAEGTFVDYGAGW
ncbi:hypothetical protein M0R45_006333 [Rubus argutus]|uniref:MHC class I antigen n=1 Tax=Rubus argutus TaxID=59490 RepID=A0AAW1YQ85_RUBAR